MVTRDSPYLTTDHTVVKKKFPLLSLVCYLFNVMNDNRHKTRGSSGNALSAIPLVMYLLSLVTRPFFGLCHDSLNSLNSVKAI